MDASSYFKSFISGNCSFIDDTETANVRHLEPWIQGARRLDVSSVC